MYVIKELIDLVPNQMQKLSVLPETWTLGSFKSPSTCARTKQVISKTKQNFLVTMTIEQLVFEWGKNQQIEELQVSVY